MEEVRSVFEVADPFKVEDVLEKKVEEGVYVEYFKSIAKQASEKVQLTKSNCVLF